MDALKFNKIAAAVLCAGLLIMGFSKVGSFLVNPKDLKENAYPIEVANVDSNSRVQDLSESEIKSISDVISSSHNVEGDLRREVSGNIKRLKDLGAYRGVRHRKNLPCRGQRTHTNARTKKGKAIAIAGKKKVTK